MTGVSLSMTEFLVRARDAIPTFAGIKYTHNDLMEYQQCIELAGGDLDVRRLPGRERQRFRLGVERELVTRGGRCEEDAEPTGRDVSHGQGTGCGPAGACCTPEGERRRLGDDLDARDRVEIEDAVALCAGRLVGHRLGGADEHALQLGRRQLRPCLHGDGRLPRHHSRRSASPVDEYEAGGAA